MAFQSGKDTVVMFNQNNLSTYMNSVDNSRTADVAETTSFSASAKTYLVGENDATISLSGLYDATADAIVQPLLSGGTQFDYVQGQTDLTTSARCTFGIANITNYGVSSPVGDVVATSLDLQATGGFFSGVVVIASAFTATGVQGSVIDNGALTSSVGGGFIIVSSVSGTSPTAVVKIQHSADNSTYADLITFTLANSATSEIKTIAKGTTINRYIRISNTIGGSSTPTVNATVGFGRNN